MRTEEQQKKHDYYQAHKEIWLKNAIDRKEANNEHKRAWEKRNPEKRMKQQANYAMANLTAIQKYQREHYQKNKETKQIRRKEICETKRNEFLEMYGNECQCCGEKIIQFLVIDHIKGQKGVKWKETGVKAYRKALSKHDPETYRILCHNCNMATRFGEACPHQTKS